MCGLSLQFVVQLYNSVIINGLFLVKIILECRVVVHTEVGMGVCFLLQTIDIIT